MLLLMLLPAFVLAVVVSIAFILRLDGDGGRWWWRDALDTARKITRRPLKLGSQGSRYGGSACLLLQCLRERPGVAAVACRERGGNAVTRVCEA
jgi:hypothetical protein